MSHLRWQAGASGRILRALSGVRESSEGLQVHQAVAWRSQARTANRPDLPRVRRSHGNSSRALRGISRLQQVSEMSRHEVDAYRSKMSQGRRGHRRAALEEEREGVLRVLQLSQV